MLCWIQNRYRSLLLRRCKALASGIIFGAALVEIFHRKATRLDINSRALNLTIVLLMVTFMLSSCISGRPPDLTVLASSPEQITYEVMLESALFSRTRAPTPLEVTAAAEKFCVQYKRKALFVRTVQRAANMQNITYDCVAPS